MARHIFNYDNINEHKMVTSLKSDDLYKNSISACGCLLYKIKNNKIELLLIKYENKNWPLLDDFGGQIDNTDKSVYDAMVREIEEETNNVITGKIISKKKIVKTFYNHHSKYHLLLIQVDDEYDDTSIFGDFEKTDNIKRTIDWYPYKDVKNKIAFRLKIKDLTDYFDSY